MSKIMNMNRIFVFLSLLSILSLAPESQGGPIVYNFDSYPSFQNGYTLTGTITTDGTLGTILPSDLLSWNFTATLGSSTISGSSTDPWATAGWLAAEATSTQFIFTLLPVDVNLMGFSGSGFALNYLLNDLSGSDGYSLTGGEMTYWDTVEPVPPGFSLGNNPVGWVIASVPEPGTLMLGSLGLAGIAATHRARRRRAAVGCRPSGRRSAPE
jgi:hypothetical protein